MSLGAKHIDTKVREVDIANPRALFNEKFQMKTVIDYDNANQKYVSKKVG